MKRTIYLFVCFLAPTLLWAKAYFAPVDEMVKKAEIIAIVDIAVVDPTSTKGTSWTYGEKASGKVEKVIKGKLSDKVNLFGGEDFICAQVHFKPGRQLVFLRHDGDLLVGSNWHLSVRPIMNEKVGWYQDKAGITLIEKPIPEVLSEIQVIMGGR